MQDLLQDVHLPLDLLSSHTSPAGPTLPLLNELGRVFDTRAFLFAAFDYCKLPAAERKKKKKTKEMEITLRDKLILSYNISLWIVLQGGEQVVIKVSTINNRMELRVKTDVWEEAACLKQMNYEGAAHHFLFPTPVREQSHRAGV